MITAHKAPIGIFDSGVGGLTVVRAIQNRLPHEDLVFLADQAFVPYGEKPLPEVQERATRVVRFLLDQTAKLIVVACNTASAAALQSLRETFPETPFVGLEPAVKPAAIKTSTRHVGILATDTTFQGQMYAALLDRFAQDITVHQHSCPGLVMQIEAGDLNSAQTRQILESALGPMLSAGVDNIVLGCTHYPFVLPLIQSITGDGVSVIDPAPAVAEQVAAVLERRGLGNPSSDAGQLRILTTGDPKILERRIPLYLATKNIGQAIESDHRSQPRFPVLGIRLTG